MAKEPRPSPNQSREIIKEGQSPKPPGAFKPKLPPAPPPKKK